MDDAPAPNQRPKPHCGLAAQDHPERDVKALAQQPLRKEQHGNDAHGLLRIVAAMPQRVQRRRKQLRRAKEIVHRRRHGSNKCPRDDEYQKQREEKAEQRRKNDCGSRYAEAVPDDRAETCLRDRGAGQSADQRVRAARGNPQPPGDQVPADRSHQSAEYHRRIDDIRRNDPGSNRLGDMEPEEQECDKIEERGPDDGVLRSQHAGGHDGRNRVGGVMQPIQGIEDQRDRDQRNESERAERGIHSEPYTFSITIALISFATSWNRSTTISRWLYTSVPMTKA